MKKLLIWIVILAVLGTCVSRLANVEDRNISKVDDPAIAFNEPAGDVSDQKVPIDRKEKFSVPADPGVTYYVIGDVKRLSSGLVVITTERDSPRGGKSYAIREVDCSKRRARYIGDSDSLEVARADAKSRKYVGNFAQLISGSSTDTVAKLACKLVK